MTKFVAKGLRVGLKSDYFRIEIKNFKSLLRLFCLLKSDYFRIEMKLYYSLTIGKSLA